jgi:hypothetical protein
MQIKPINFPYLALASGVFLLLVVTIGNETDAEGFTALPLLTLLIFNEGAFLLTAVGSYIGLKQLYSIGFNFGKNPLYFMTTVICILLTIQFVILGIKLWPL